MSPQPKRGSAAGDRTVLGNLPRSRPGTRSARRAAKPRSTAKAAGSGATARSGAAARKTASAPPPASHGADPVRTAVDLAVKVVETGVGVASKVAGGILRRLPRP